MMETGKRKLFPIVGFLLFLIIHPSVYGKPVGIVKAMDYATGFLKSNGMGTDPVQMVYSNQKTLGKSGNAVGQSYYVFNIGSDGGFVIVAGDDCADAILGFSNEGSFSPRNIPENVHAWLCEYANQIEYLQSTMSMDELEILPTKSLVYTDVEPLIKSKWSQNYPYNRLLPNIYPSSFGYDNDYKSPKRLMTGCVATALAQIMNYYKYPASGKGSHSYNAYYKFNEDGTYTRYKYMLLGYDKMVTYEANFGNTDYDWNHMKMSYSGNESIDDSSVVAVATLMQHCGIAVDMIYGTFDDGGSAAYVNFVPSAIKKYFKYDDGAKFIERKSMSNQEWLRIVYKELLERRPVFYAGYVDADAKVGGHAFICDGYLTDSLNQQFFHINWGWGGSFNGYFKLSALVPTKDYDYSYSQQAVIGFQPILGDEYIVIDRDSVELLENEQIALTATVLPVNVGTVVWGTEDSAVAVVSSKGIVSATGVGCTGIFATSANCDTAVCVISVVENVNMRADAFKEKHKDILETDMSMITCNDSVAVDNALSDYDLLSIAVQDLLIEQHNLLLSLKMMISELKRIDDEEKERMADINPVFFEGTSEIYTPSGYRIERITAPGPYIINGQQVLIDRLQ